MINKKEKSIRALLPGIVAVLFFLYLGSYPVLSKELGDLGIPDGWTLICMDLLELELPDDDQSGDMMELPDIEKIEDPALTGTSPSSQGRTRSVPQIKSVPIKPSGPSEPTFSPELSPFLFPSPEKTSSKPREKLPATVDNSSEPSGQLMPMELKAMPLPSNGTETASPALREPATLKGPSEPPEIPLLDMNDWAQEPSAPMPIQPQQPSTSLKKPGVLPEKGLDFLAAPVKSQPQDILPRNEKIDVTLIRIYERFFKEK